MSSKPVIVLVPGAWHVPEAYHLVVGELEAAGYETRGVKFASVGSPEPLKDIQPDVEAIQQVMRPLIEDQGKDVLLVVHSYGGVVGNEAVKDLDKASRAKQGKKGGVSHIYFCCAFALPEGVSLMDALNQTPLPWFQINDSEDIVTPATPIDTFYNDVDGPEKYVAMLKPHSYRTFFSKMTNPGWKYIPSTYLLCEKDEAIPLHAQKGMVEGAQKAGAQMKVESMDVSHSPFLSMPQELARSIRRAAGESV
ncbi:uncharacterized protein Z520_05868 [Fonsecaea multimorphosa CBS 102226]|uniref:AB hydrolase-1 domain-containing protein n=1 Tax=Fonsecaea multimorphosa CBS 102226 TaxID=1442371 RepID=A0A0D2JYF0_9EURO|nr:uncharacterized protein Z520_05868 [Fonsecaea multimorphosa CBS 102226]KIX98567.1 hypothetical protein Z520_05868 [Fonsecaea multimorphosa CBS 102226]OAL24758.1 hypothetical protein AYO22_05547 [Fonsecaea multimorphosa]